MMPTPNSIMEDALSYLDEIGTVGRAKVTRFLNSLADSRKATEVVAVIVRAEEPGYRWQSGWKRAARAWMLCKLVSDDYLIYGYWGAPAEHVIAGWVVSLQTMYEPDLQSEIASMLMFTGAKHLSACQGDPSRARWDKGFFTDPQQHKCSNFCYIVYAMTGSVSMPTIVEGSTPRSDYLKDSLSKYLDQSASAYNFRCAEYYLKKPSVLYTELLSCSIIRHDHTKTYRNSPFGFVLGVPKDLLC